METLTTTQLAHMPLLKGLLINYISLNYEEASDYRDDSLIAEYNWLAKNNQLGLLFEAEFLQGPDDYTSG